jgi:hypothetical protein
MSEMQGLIFVFENPENNSVVDAVLALDKKTMDEVFLAGGT